MFLRQQVVGVEQYPSLSNRGKGTVLFRAILTRAYPNFIALKFADLQNFAERWELHTMGFENIKFRIIR